MSAKVAKLAPAIHSAIQLAFAASADVALSRVSCDFAADLSSPESAAIAALTRADDANGFNVALIAMPLEFVGATLALIAAHGASFGKPKKGVHCPQYSAAAARRKTAVDGLTTALRRARKADLAAFTGEAADYVVPPSLNWDIKSEHAGRKLSIVPHGSLVQRNMTGNGLSEQSTDDAPSSDAGEPTPAVALTAEQQAEAIAQAKQLLLAHGFVVLTTEGHAALIDGRAAADATINTLRAELLKLTKPATKRVRAGKSVDFAKPAGQFSAEAIAERAALRA